MMDINLSDFKSTVPRMLQNIPGWRTNRKIVVIQSDDWGSIRMPSLKVREKLDKHPAINADTPYCHYDTLASAEDLEALFGVLMKFKDKNGNHPIITANCVMANPDFDRIKDDNFNQYYYELISETFRNYHQENALKLWEKGIDAGIFLPQFHGREHLNVSFWLKALRNNHPGVKAAFDQKVFGVKFKKAFSKRNDFQASWDYKSKQQEKIINKFISEGLILFKKKFGYKSITMIAPAYTWSNCEEKELLINGVRCIQTIPIQKVPTRGDKRYKKKYHFTSINLYKAYQVRNVFFEPTLMPDVNWISDALKRIEIIFNMHKPAIISAHRVNFIGTLNTSNRNKNLIKFKIILESIIDKWPEVEFMGAEQLFELMEKSKS